MTSMPVTNIAVSYRAVTTGGTDNAGKSDGFGMIYDSAKTKVNAEEKMNTEKSEKTFDRSVQTADTGKPSVAKQDEETEMPEADVTGQKTDAADDAVKSIPEEDGEEIPEEVLEDAMAWMLRTVQQALETVAAELGTDVETVTGIMEDLNLRPEDILNSDNMAAIVTAQAGESDPMALTTNEELYDSVQNLIEAMDELNDSLQEETLLTREDLVQLMQGREDQSVNMGTVEADVPKQMTDAESVSQETDNKTNGFVQETGAESKAADVEQSSNEGERESRHEDGKTNADGMDNHPFLNTSDTMNAGTADGIFAQTIHHGQEIADGIDIIRQLTDYMHTQQKEDLTQMELQLHPATLGTIHMTISSREGVVTASIQTQNEAVRSALESQVMTLRQNLEEQGVKVEAIEVTVASHEFERNLEQNNEQERQDYDRTQGTSGKKRAIRHINLNDESETEEPDADDEIRIAREMMRANGNTVDYTV